MPKVCFRLGHPQFNPHRGLKIEDADDEADGDDPILLSINGRPLDLVIEPAVLRYGNQDGKCYDKFKVLHKGTVWVVSDGNLNIPAKMPAPKSGPKSLPPPDSKRPYIIESY